MALLQREHELEQLQQQQQQQRERGRGGEVTRAATATATVTTAPKPHMPTPTPTPTLAAAAAAPATPPTRPTSRMRARHVIFPVFIVFASQGRFMALFLSDGDKVGGLGLSDAQVGTILGLGVVTGALSTPWWAARADSAAGGPVRVLRELVAAHAVVAASLGLVALTPHGAARFWTALACRIAATSLAAPAGSVLDGLTLQSLEDKARYGEERLWGAVSWAIANALMGVLVDAGAAPIVVSVVTLLVGSAWALASLWLFARQQTSAAAVVEPTPYVELPSSSSVPEQQQQQQQQQPSRPNGPPGSAPLMLQFVWAHMDFRLALFLLTACVMGAATSLVENLLFLFMRNDLKAGYALCGLSVVITVSFEIPIFAVGKRLLARFGAKVLILAGMAAYVVRVVVYTLVSDAAFVLVVEPLHGVTYSFMQTSLVAYMADVAPPGTTSTGQGLLNLCRDVGRLVGTVGGGFVLQELGSSVMYRSAAVAVLVNMAFVAWKMPRAAADVGGNAATPPSPPPPSVSPLPPLQSNSRASLESNDGGGGRGRGRGEGHDEIEMGLISHDRIAP